MHISDVHYILCGTVCKEAQKGTFSNTKNQHLSLPGRPVHYGIPNSPQKACIRNIPVYFEVITHICIFARRKTRKIL